MFSRPRRARTTRRGRGSTWTCSRRLCRSPPPRPRWACAAPQARALLRRGGTGRRVHHVPGGPVVVVVFLVLVRLRVGNSASAAPRSGVSRRPPGKPPSEGKTGGSTSTASRRGGDRAGISYSYGSRSHLETEGFFSSNAGALFSRGTKDVAGTAIRASRLGTLPYGKRLTASRLQPPYRLRRGRGPDDASRRAPAPRLLSRRLNAESSAR